MNRLLGRNKGISPLIASVLLIAFTMSVAVLFSPWATDMVQSIQEGTTEDAKSLATASNMDIGVASASFNRSTRNLSIVVQNDGEESFENFSITVRGDKAYNKEFSKSLEPKEISTVEMYAGDPFDMEEVSVSLTGYPISTEREVDGVPAENHLVGYWPMDSETGVYANDSVSDNDGVLKNGSNTCSGGLCPEWRSGIYEEGIRLHGRDDYVIKNPTAVFPDNEFTVSYWIKTKDSGDSPFSYATSNSDNELLLFKSQSVTVYIGGPNVNTGVSVNDGEWHHLTVTWKSDDGEIRAFKDAHKQFESTHQQGYSIPGDGSLVIGQEQDSVGGGFNQNQAFNGTIDEIRIWNKAISPKRIKDPVILK